MVLLILVFLQSAACVSLFVLYPYLDVNIPISCNSNTEQSVFAPVSVLWAAPRGEGRPFIRGHQASLRDQLPAPLSLQTGFDTETRPHHTVPLQRPMGHAQSDVRKPWVLGFFFVKENFQVAHPVTVSSPSAVNYHKSYILRRRNNHNSDQQNWRLNHHVHRYFRSHQEPGDNQEQTYDVEPLQDVDQELQREKRHQKVAKHSEQEETHWLASGAGNHRQRASRSAGPEARMGRKTSTNGSQTRGQFHQHSSSSRPGPEHSWGFSFSRRSPSLSSLHVLKRERKRCFTVIGIQVQCVGFPSGAPPVFFYTVIIFYPCQCHISETTLCYNWRRNLIFTAAGLKTGMALCHSLSIIIIFVHPHHKRLKTPKTSSSSGDICFSKSSASPVSNNAVDGWKRNPDKQVIPGQ